MITKKGETLQKKIQVPLKATPSCKSPGISSRTSKARETKDLT